MLFFNLLALVFVIQFLQLHNICILFHDLIHLISINTFIILWIRVTFELQKIKQYNNSNILNLLLKICGTKLGAKPLLECDDLHCFQMYTNNTTTLPSCRLWINISSWCLKCVEYTTIHVYSVHPPPAVLCAMSETTQHGHKIPCFTGFFKLRVNRALCFQ